MSFKLGDFVRFVDERREGYITRIIDDLMVGVTGEDDFEIPVPVSKITPVYGHEASGIKTQAKAPATQTENFVENGIFLGISSDPKLSSVAYFHLINTTSYQLFITLNSEHSGKHKGEFAGSLAPLSVEKIYAASLSQLNSWPKFEMQILFFSEKAHDPKKPLGFSEKFTAKDFSGPKKSAPIFAQPAWLFQIDQEQLVIDPQKLKESFFKSTEEKTGLPQPLREIDLHIEKLRDDHQFLNSSEMLQIQLTEFRNKLDAAIVHKMPSIIFIHGLGNGTLRSEIHKAVSKHPQVKTFMDARKEKFGYGATEVVFK